MNKKIMYSNLLLGLAAFIWGVAFVAQSVGMEYVGPFTFNACRFLIGGMVLLPCIYLFHKKRIKETVKTEASFRESQHLPNSRHTTTQKSTLDIFGIPEQKSSDSDGTFKRKNQKGPSKNMAVTGGICCGCVLFVASSFQQFGIVSTSVGKAGFITALYIVIVPCLGIFLGKKVSWNVWISVAVATVGMYLLCMTEGLSVSKGDIYVFLCAICFSFHILIIDYVSPRADGVVISCVQFFTAGILSSVMMIIFETPSLSSIATAWAPVLYAGVMSCGVAYTLQVVGQKNTDPVLASLILSMESAFSLLSGWVILKQKLSLKELSGCLFVFCAIILAQIPIGKAKK